MGALRAGSLFSFSVLYTIVCLAFLLTVFFSAVRVDHRPIRKCEVDGGACVFTYLLDGGNKLCLRRIHGLGVIRCETGEWNAILHLRVAPEAGGLAFEAITINTGQDPPLVSQPSSDIGFVPDPRWPHFINEILLRMDRVYFEWPWLKRSEDSPEKTQEGSHAEARNRNALGARG